jgi:CMP-N,N'-diacetyllegionaminic acid synthase
MTWNCPDFYFHLLMPDTIAIIPARGGSKGVPRKNVRMLAGKPLILWTVECALMAERFDRVIVSTDDPEIAEVSMQSGAEVPFLRPRELASDTATSLDVVMHALNWLEQHGGVLPSSIMLLQPTSPMREKRDIQDAVDLLRETSSQAVVSVCPSAHPPHWLRKIDAEGRIHSWLPEQIPNRRQDSEAFYQINGSIYLIKQDVLVRERTFLPSDTRALIMPEDRSVDIDTPWDFYLADLIMKNKHTWTNK